MSLSSAKTNWNAQFPYQSESSVLDVLLPTPSMSGKTVESSGQANDERTLGHPQHVLLIQDTLLLPQRNRDLYSLADPKSLHVLTSQKANLRIVPSLNDETSTQHQLPQWVVWLSRIYNAEAVKTPSAALYHNVTLKKKDTRSTANLGTQLLSKHQAFREGLQGKYFVRQSAPCWDSWTNNSRTFIPVLWMT